MALDLYKKEQIRSMFLAQGRYVTDAQIEEYYNKAQATQATQQSHKQQLYFLQTLVRRVHVILSS